jgi:cytochrome c oxidase cbb3-type subunit I/II
MYWFRVLGGLFFLSGFILMLYNIIKTIQLAPASAKQKMTSVKIRVDNPSLVETGHRKLEGMATVFSVLALVAILVGTIIEIYPMINVYKYLKADRPTEPYTPLELAGRDIYIKEGCYTCHSQMIRKMTPDVLRYGAASKMEDSVYDHPFQWGSKRTGPDLAREGGKYPDLWHFRHMIDPRSTTPQSIMPTYPWLLEHDTDFSILRKKLSVMKAMDVPYEDNVVASADDVALVQAKTIAESIAKQGGPAGIEKKEIVALISYLQALGKKTK